MRDNIIVSLIVDTGIFLSLIGCYHILSLVMPHRFNKKVTITTILLYTTLLFSLSYYYGVRSTISVNIFRGISYLPFLLVLYEGKFYQKVFAFFLHFLVINICAVISNEVALLIIPVQREILFMMVSFIVYIIILAGYIVLLRLYWRGIFHKLFSQEKSAVHILYVIGIVFSYAALVSLRLALVTGPLFIALILFVMWSFIILCFAVINTHEKAKQKYEADLSKEIIASWENHYRKTDHLLSKYLFNQKDEEKNHITLHFCDNKIMNKLLGWFAQRCKEENIKHSFNVALPQDLPVSDFDICIIVGNLLENAMEACLKIEADKRIDLNIMLHNEQFVLKVENTCIPNTEDVEGTSPGLHSVKLVTERYSGNLYIKSNENIYTVSVLIPLGN